MLKLISTTALSFLFLAATASTAVAMQRDIVTLTCEPSFIADPGALQLSFVARVIATQGAPPIQAGCPGFPPPSPQPDRCDDAIELLLENRFMLEFTSPASGFGGCGATGGGQVYTFIK